LGNEKRVSEKRKRVLMPERRTPNAERGTLNAKVRCSFSDSR
jgi:hypothetical protein